MDVRQLAAEIGQRLNAPLALNDAGMARLTVDNEFALDFELDEARARLLAYMVVGAPDARLNAELLAANLFGAETGAASPALDAERNELLLWLAFDENTGIEAALAALENLIERTAHWRARLAQGGTREAPLEARLPPEFALGLRA